MRFLNILIMTGIILLLIGCSGANSPFIPSANKENDSHSLSIESALSGVELLNTENLAVYLNGVKLTPWGIKDVLLDPAGKYPLVVETDSNDIKVEVSVEGAVILDSENPVHEIEVLSGTEMKVTNLQPEIVVNVSTQTDPKRTRSIIVRTKPSEHLPIPPRIGSEDYTLAETGETFEVLTRELLVGVEKDTPDEVFEALSDTLDCEILRRIPRIDAFRIRFPEYSNFDEMISRFQDSSIVVYAEVNSVKYPQIVPNDTFESQEYENALCQMHQAWDISTGGPGTKVAIIDSGVMRDHPDLAANIIDGEDFISPTGDGLGGATPGDGVDNNGDGVVDGNVEHGTHVAGIAAAVGNNSEGVSGHSWSAKIFSLRVFPVDGDSGAEDSAVSEAIIYAGDNGAISVNMSLGGSFGSQTEQNAINYSWGKGSVIIAAAGNSNSSSGNFYPAYFNNVVAVAATSSTDQKASFSNYNAKVDVSAPGVNIPSSIFYTYTGSPYNVPENQRYALYNGTSMASPQVAGLAVLIAHYFPTYTNAEIVDQIIYTADDIYPKNPSYVGMLGSGRINDYRALTTPLDADFEITSFASDDDLPLFSQGNRDGYLNPGEIIELYPSVKNIGLKAAPATVMTLVGGNGIIETLVTEVTLGYIERGNTVTPTTPLIFRVKNDAPDGAMADLTLHFEYTNGTPIEINYQLPIKADMGVLDTVNFSGNGLIHTEIAKGSNDLPVLELIIEGDTNYATLEKLVIKQLGTADSNDIGEVQLWLDADDNDVFSKTFDKRLAYRSYYHDGFRGQFDDLNDPNTGFGFGVGYEDFGPVTFDATGTAVFEEITVPTVPGSPRAMFVVLNVLPTATTGHTVKIAVQSASDVYLKTPDIANPINFPIETDEVPIVGQWLTPQRLTFTANNGTSWRAETAACPVSGNVYVVYDSDGSGNFDVYFRRSTNQGETFDSQINLDSSTASEFYPDIAVDSKGWIHIVYYSTKITNRREIYYVRSKDFGVSFEEPVRLTNAVRNRRVPKIAVGPDDSLHIAWHDDRTANNDYNIYYKSSTDGGDTWSNDVMVNDTNAQSQEAAIAVGGDGIIHIVWEEPSGNGSYNVYYSRSSNGTTWSAPFKLNTGAYNNRCYHADITADNNGNVYAIYHYVPWGADAEIVANVSNDSGANWVGNKDITNNSIPDSRPSIYVRPNGAYIDIVFRRLEAENWNIWHTYSYDGLATWSTPYQISLSEVGQAREAVVVRASNLNIYSFWEDQVGANEEYEVFWNRYLY